MRVLKGAWKGPASISFSPDGSTIAAADSDLSNPSIRLWDVETGTARVLGHRRGRLLQSLFFPTVNGSRAEAGMKPCAYGIFKPARRILGENCSCISHVAISTGGERIAAASLDGRIRVWEIETGRSRTIGHCSGVNALAFTSVLVTGGEDGTLRLWNTDRF